jgi:hypothetical protein
MDFRYSPVFQNRADAKRVLQRCSRYRILKRIGEMIFVIGVLMLFSLGLFLEVDLTPKTYLLLASGTIGCLGSILVAGNMRVAISRISTQAETRMDKLAMQIGVDPVRVYMDSASEIRHIGNMLLFNMAMDFVEYRDRTRRIRLHDATLKFVGLYAQNANEELEARMGKMRLLSSILIEFNLAEGDALKRFLSEAERLLKNR